MVINGIHVDNKAVPYSGTITEVNDTEVIIRIAARMGILKVPHRAVLSKNYPKVGDKVTFLMSLIEIDSDGYEGNLASQYGKAGYPLKNGETQHEIRA